MLFIHETFLVYKLETFKNCKEVKQIMIMIIVIIYIFFILCDIWSTVEHYLQKILRPPWKNPPLKIQKVQVLPPFFANIENFSANFPSRGGRGVRHCTPQLYLMLILNKYFYSKTTAVAKTTAWKRSLHS